MEIGEVARRVYGGDKPSSQWWAKSRAQKLFYLGVEMSDEGGVDGENTVDREYKDN